MKRLIILLAALILAFIGWHLASPQADQTDLSGLSDGPKQPSPTSTVTDPAVVFQKAFWKRPTPEDRILHAERREWQDKDGLSKWQWFIAVKPSPALVDHLISDNAFMLTPRSGRREHADDPPKWFPTEAPQTFANPNGTFQILWYKEQNLLHATDSGSGFRPGAPEPVKAITASQPEGRLPTTPPPKP
jgi:hypothetical protein